VPTIPGTEGLVALAIGKIAAKLHYAVIPKMFANIDITEIANISGISESQLQELGELYGNAQHPIAIPGGSALTTKNGLQSAKAILGLNVLASNLGLPGGVFLAQGDVPVSDINEIKSLIQRMNAGEIETLLIHGVNPIFELPPALGFRLALSKVKNIISFATFEDETAIESDYVLPDHSPLESFGYQRVLAGADRVTLSAVQPVVQPIHDTKATADVLLAAVSSLGNTLSSEISYSDEVDFLQQKITPFIEAGGFYTASELPTFWSKWLQYGGWWKPESGLRSASDSSNLNEIFTFEKTESVIEGKEFHLVSFGTQMGDGHGANRPWLQETPDPMTTVTWNSWVEIHPETADHLGIHDDDIVTITGVSGTESIEAIVYRYPAIRPDTVAIPFGQGHSALGRYAEGRGCNPANLWSGESNQAGELAISDTKVTITPTGKRRPLARQESKAGVYGEH
jgi:anaerobic selenocysteine-containing dehydrogenase